MDAQCFCLGLICLASYVFITSATVVEYVLMDHNLTAVPDNIPANVTELDLSQNDICQVQNAAFPEQLEEIKMSKNCLGEFPDLCVLNMTLKRVFMASNGMESIHPDYLSCLQTMDRLDVGVNKLTSFPNVYLPNIDELNIYNNKFTQVPPLINIVPEATYIHLSQNPFTYTYNDIPDEVRLYSILLTAF